MALDNDVIERAMDAAEAQLAEKEVIQPSSSESVSDTPKEDLVETAEVEKLKAKSSPDAAPRARGEKGRFVAKTATSSDKNGAASSSSPTEDEQVSSDQTANAGEQNPEQQAENAQEPQVEAPAFWSAEAKAAFAKGDINAVRKYAVQYEQQRTEWANRLANEYQRGKAIEEKSKEVFEPYRLKLQANGISDPLDAAKRLLAWNEMFETDPVRGIKELMRRNNLTPQHLMYEDAPEVTNQYQDPRFEEYVQKQEELQRKLDSYEQAAKQSQTLALQQEIHSFRNGKDSTGQVRAQYLDMYEPQIADAVKHIKEQYPQMPRSEALNAAYEFVLGEARKAFGVGSQPAPASAPPQPSADAKKAKAAATSVTGGPANGTTPSRPRAKSIDEALDRAEARLGI